MRYVGELCSKQCRAKCTGKALCGQREEESQHYGSSESSREKEGCQSNIKGEGVEEKKKYRKNQLNNRMKS